MSDNSRIAKNTIFMYMRMAITMLVGLYTSRVVLRVLGVEDYGLFNVIGGIIVLFTVLNNALTNAILRFITLSLAKGNLTDTRQTFNMALLNEMNARRREIAARYSSAFGGLPFVAPVTMDGCEHVFHQYTIRCHGRDDIARLLKDHGVGTGILYPVPIHLQKAYLHEQMDARLPVTERLAKEILSLPVCPELSDAEVDYVIATVKDCAVKQ